MKWFRQPTKLPTNLIERAQSLNDELDKAIRHYRRLARLNYHFMLFLVWVAILASAAIAIGGILFDASAKLLGVIALVPTIATLINSVYQPQARSNWHYKKRDRLNALRRRLQFELPMEPSADNIAAISNEWTKLDSEMDQLWEKNVTIDWSAITSIRRPSAEQESQQSK
jgi:hypothetical protein